MALFRYEAADSGGKTMRGSLEAKNVSDVQAQLSARGFSRVHVLASATEPVASRRPGALVPIARADDLALFFRQMVSLTKAGFSPSTALADLAPRTANKSIADAAFAMARETAGGSSLAASMVRHGGAFPEHTIGLIAAGETGGFLEFAFEEAALWAEGDVALRKGLWWPKILFWQSIWSVLLFQPLFPSIDTKRLEQVVPLLLVNYGKAMLFCVPLGLLLHLGAYLFQRYLATTAGAPTRDRLMLAFPVTRRLAIDRAMASFTRVLRRLLASGLSPSLAFAGAVEAAPNGILRDRLRKGIPILRQAGGLDQAILATGMMEHDPVQLLTTGQRTGTWNESLDQVAAYYQERAADATEAARRAQKRAGVLITILSMGYVTIVSTYYMMKIPFQVADGIEAGG